MGWSSSGELSWEALVSSAHASPQAPRLLSSHLGPIQDSKAQCGQRLGALLPWLGSREADTRGPCPFCSLCQESLLYRGLRSAGSSEFIFPGTGLRLQVKPDSLDHAPELWETSGQPQPLMGNGTFLCSVIPRGTGLSYPSRG